MKFKLDSGVTGTFFVCKIFGEDSVGQLTKKRSVEDDTSGIVKKSRTDQNSAQFEECEIHLKEIERLKGELSQRDQEISSLNKIIAALARKQGL